MPAVFINARQMYQARWLLRPAFHMAIIFQINSHTPTSIRAGKSMGDISCSCFKISILFFLNCYLIIDCLVPPNNTFFTSSPAKKSCGNPNSILLASFSMFTCSCGMEKFALPKLSAS